MASQSAIRGLEWLFALMALAIVAILITSGKGEAENTIATTTPTNVSKTGTSQLYAGQIKTAFQPDDLVVFETLPPQNKDISITIRRGEAVVDAIARAGISKRDALLAINSMSGLVDARRIRAGERLDIQKDDTDSLTSLKIRTAFDTVAVSNRTEEGQYTAAAVNLPTLTLANYREATIDDSLFMAAERAGIPAAITVELIRIFSFDVDFQREIRPGDSFAVYYQQRMTEDGMEYTPDDILYARLTLKGEDMEFYQFHPDGDPFPDYFDATGESARRALMKTPVAIAYVTSSYGARKHPVLGYTRMHKGVDFRAPTGTPIYAAGDGVVERASRWGSYGNYVRIRHNGTYKTAYAHLSRYGSGIKAGAHVKQGQVIGYSGATGRVTAAHLHYEVLKNDEQVNPLNLNLPTGRTLTGSQLQQFNNIRPVIAEDTLRLKNAVILAETNTEPLDVRRADTGFSPATAPVRKADD